MSETPSPCRKICRLDDTHSYCEACGRAIDEIARWGRLDEAERRRIVDEIPSRTPSEMITRAEERRRLRKKN